jgi:diguanylate cyclase (GGDEF)-like protein
MLRQIRKTIGTGLKARSTIPALALLLGLIAGTYAIARATTDYLLRRDATEDARNWAEFLADNVSDIGAIAAGETPSATSMAFLDMARKSREVYRYKIFNPEGYSQLVSEPSRVALAELSEFSEQAARAAATHQPVVALLAGSAPDAAYYSLAFVPVVENGTTVAVVAAYLDRTSHREAVQSVFLKSAAALCGLSALAFGIPAIAWYRRTREKQIADRRIRFLALHDPLTGLTNRARLTETLNLAVAGAHQSRRVAVHFIDIDHFKQINDIFGHPGGDLLLTTLAHRLRDEVRIEDMVARVGGDEFVAIQRDVTSKESVEKLATRIRASLARPITFGGQQIVTTISVGIAIAPEDGTDAERLLRSADLALYKCKEDGRDCIRFFSPEMDAALQKRIAVETAIRDALANGGFVLHYQPVYLVGSHQLVGFEALIRLPRPDGTLVPPADFIPIAEEMRVIDKIGAWVLQEACRTAATWPNQLHIAVNISASEFEMNHISATVRHALKESKLDPHRLEIEITEQVLLKESEHISEELWALKKMGVAIVMDDFGTGYSSLGYLLRFPFNKLKIDQSFIQRYGDPNDSAAAVIKAMIALGRELNLRVTVEGVETAEQEGFLSEAAGDQAQGFFLGRPVPASAMADVIKAGRYIDGGDGQPRIEPPAPQPAPATAPSPS